MVTNLLIIFPIILAGVLFIYLLASHVEVQSHFYELCRTDLSQTQNLVNQELNLLMALNPLISSSEWIGVALKIAMAFSYANPILVVLFKGLASGVDSLKQGVSRLQKILIKAMESTMTLGTLFTKTQIQSTFFSYKLKLTNLTDLNSLSLKYNRSPKPAVEKTHKNKAISTYKLSPDFTRKQQLQVSWVFNSKIAFKFSPYAILNKSFKGKCIFSLDESEPWKIIQIAVR